MDVYTHTALVIACMVIPYYVGRFLSKRSMMENIVAKVIAALKEEAKASKK